MLPLKELEKIMKKTGIIFDMDGTLWDSSKAVAASWTETLRQRYGSNRRITAQEIKAVMGLTMDRLAAAIFPDAGEAKRMEMLEVCCKAENRYLLTHGGILYDGLEETWEKLKKQHSLYIVSNCQQGYIEAFLTHYGFGAYFDDIECYGNNSLPKGVNIKKVVERNALDDAAYVGDIQGDYEASLMAGVKFIHAAYGFGKVAADVPKIHSFPELYEVANRMF